MQQLRPIMKQHCTRPTLPAASAFRVKNPFNTTRTCNKLPHVYM
jgi:hypothetical protein